MINANWRSYDYFTLGALDEYGQDKVSDTPQGKVKIAIFPTSESVQQNILYLNAQYMGLTFDKSVNDKFLIDYNGERLKVLYVKPTGRMRQVFMSRVG